MVSYSVPTRQSRPDGPTTLKKQRLPAITLLEFGLFRFRSPLLSESLLFSLPVGTEMFHFPTFPPNALCVQAQVPRLYSEWVSPFGHPRITGRLSPSRGFSQTPTSFIGSRCQGIHRVPFTACHHQHHTTPTHPTTPTRGHQGAQTQRTRIDGSTLQRCSRPLSRSQTTTPHHTPHTHSVHDRCSRETRNKVPTRTPRALPGPVASGPNSVPNTTQQTRPPNVPGPTPKRSVRTSKRSVPPGTYLLIFHP